MLNRPPRASLSELTPTYATSNSDELLRLRHAERWGVRVFAVQSHKTPRFPKSSHGSAIQMDVVSHCVEALRFIAGLSDSQIQDIGFELALVGRQGFDTNSSVKRYRFAGIPDRGFSGLEAIAWMYCFWQKIDANVDVGADFGREYGLANQTLSRK